MKYSFYNTPSSNAFAIMGYVRKIMKNEGFTLEEIEDYTGRASSGDYKGLVEVSKDMINLVNERSK